MPAIGFKVYLPVAPAQAFERVTRFPASGRPRRRTLEEFYGRLLQQDANVYTFQDRNDEEARWRCRFDPPNFRVMEAVDSPWADRYDVFEPSGEGALWTVSWQLKDKGFKAWMQWLTFRLGGKRQAYEQTIAPILSHFSPTPPPAETAAAAKADDGTAAGRDAREDANAAETPNGGEAPRRPRPRVRRRRRT